MYSENLIRETEKEMTEIDNKKRMDFIKGIALREKILLQQTGRVDGELSTHEHEEIK